ncbi:response regulator [Candidatus Sumerlaeota bacterium]|nr:response regulator [Candidatus Sumerlaeota bacterium]
MAKILIVDDEEAVRNMVKKMLSMAGYDTVCAKDGNEAIRLWGQENPDLILLDIIMPEKDGLETVIEIRKKASDTRIIAYTGGGPFSPDELLSTAKLLGCCSVLSKPLRSDELISAVQEALES